MQNLYSTEMNNDMILEKVKSHFLKMNNNIHVLENE